MKLMLLLRSKRDTRRQTEHGDCETIPDTDRHIRGHTHTHTHTQKKKVPVLVMNLRRDKITKTHRIFSPFLENALQVSIH